MSMKCDSTSEKVQGDFCVGGDYVCGCVTRGNKGVGLQGSPQCLRANAFSLYNLSCFVFTSVLLQCAQSARSSVNFQVTNNKLLTTRNSATC
jgi:hypothetical protein